MSQVVWVIQANMGQANPAANDYVLGQAGAQATASANATTIVTNAIAALSLGTASTHAASDFATPASVSAKFTQPVGTTLQFILGDGSLSTFSTAAISAVTWSTLTGKPTFANVATSGAYSDLSGTPSLGTQMSVDSGWTANSTVGDKTASLSSYSNGINSTIITALNLAAANSGTAIGALGDIVVTLVKQVAAIRIALVAAKLPNV